MKVFQGDALQILKELPGESIDCCVTSPPYWGLRDYGHPEQIGLEPTFQLYIEHLIQIFNEVKRILKKEGTCWVVIGDTYSGIKQGNTEIYKNPKVVTKNFKKQNSQNKCLLQIPSRFAIAMTDDGWILRNKIIWYKRNCMPSSVKDRFTVDYEEILFFVKNKKYYFKQQLEPTLTKDNSVRDRDNTRLNNTSGRTKMGGLKVNNYDLRNMRTVWDIPTKPNKELHFAIFPEELVKRCFDAGCPPGGTVLDQFIGSGTTLLMAKKLALDGIGIDINPDYIKITNKRINEILF